MASYYNPQAARGAPAYQTYTQGAATPPPATSPPAYQEYTQGDVNAPDLGLPPWLLSGGGPPGGGTNPYHGVSDPGPDPRQVAFDTWANSLPGLTGSQREALQNNFNTGGLEAAQGIYTKHFAPRPPVDQSVRQPPPPSSPVDQSVRQGHGGFNPMATTQTTWGGEGQAGRPDQKSPTATFQGQGVKDTNPQENTGIQDPGASFTGQGTTPPPSPPPSQLGTGIQDTGASFTGQGTAPPSQLGTGPVDAGATFTGQGLQPEASGESSTYTGQGGGFLSPDLTGTEEYQGTGLGATGGLQNVVPVQDPLDVSGRDPNESATYTGQGMATGTGNGNGTGIDESATYTGQGGGFPAPEEKPMWDDQAVWKMIQEGTYDPTQFNAADYADPEKAQAGIDQFNMQWNEILDQQNQEYWDAYDAEQRQNAVADYIASQGGLYTDPAYWQGSRGGAYTDPPQEEPYVDPTEVIDPNVYDAQGNLISGPGHTVGPDVLGNTAATGEAAPESEGDVFEYAPPENRLMPQLEGMYQNIIDMYQGNAEIPYLKELAAQQREDQRLERDEQLSRLYSRGIQNSTLGDRSIADLGVTQRAGAANLALDTMQRSIQPQLQTMQQIYGQGADARTRSTQEFMDFYDRQFRSDRAMSDDEYRALALMAQTAGMNTAPAYQPNFGSQQGEPGLAQSTGAWAMDMLPYWLRDGDDDVPGASGPPLSGTPSGGGTVA